MNSLYKLLVLLTAFYFPVIASAQTLMLDMDRAVEIALVNSPGLKASQMSVEQQEVLKKSAIDFTDTKFTYTRGELNSRMIDYQFQVSQSVNLNYGAQLNLQKEKVKLSEITVNVDKAELTRRVRITYVLWDISYDRLNYIIALDSIYADFANAAEVRYRTGESNMLEKTAAFGKQQEVELLLAQARADVIIYQQVLGKLLNTTDSLVISESKQGRMVNVIPARMETSTNARLSLAKQQIAMAEQNASTEKSKFAPSLSVGYINQQIDGVSNNAAFALGASIPLFFWAKQGQAQAAKIGIEAAKASYQNDLLLFSARYQELEKNFQNFDRQLTYYENQGLSLAAELIKFGNIGYESGEIGYIEYSNNINQATDIQLNYLASLKNYNLIVIELLKMLGQ